MDLIKPMQDKHLLVQVLAVEVIFSKANPNSRDQTVQLKQALEQLLTNFKLVLEPPIRQVYADYFRLQ